MNYRQSGLHSARSLAILAFLYILSNSCKNEGIPADQLEKICFTEQVLPIFQNSCATSGCHVSGGEAGYDFTYYIGIMDAITAGNPDKSAAYQAMTSTFQLMPPHNPLPEGKRSIIRLWIVQGANEHCETTKSAFTN